MNVESLLSREALHDNATMFQLSGHRAFKWWALHTHSATIALIDANQRPMHTATCNRASDVTRTIGATLLLLTLRFLYISTPPDTIEPETHQHRIA